MIIDFRPHWQRSEDGRCHSDDEFHLLELLNSDASVVFEGTGDALSKAMHQVGRELMP